MLTVASYNIHRCIGSDSIYRPGRIVAVVRELDADVVALQEVDAHLMHKEGHQLDFIAKETGYHLVVGSTMLSEGAEYGNAILSRLPILRSAKHDLTVLPWEPRGALEVELAVHGHPVRILCTHLGLRYSERRRQVRALLEILSHHSGEECTVIAGDFNEWVPMVGSTMRLRKRFSHTRGLKSFPSRWPVLALDKVFVDRKRLLLRTEVFDTRLARKASDHLPVKAYLKL